MSKYSNKIKQSWKSRSPWLLQGKF
jgi:hypothetical protein